MRLLICIFLTLPFASAQSSAQSSAQPLAAPGQTAANKLDPLHQLSSNLEALSHRVSKSVVQIFSTGYALSESSESGQVASTITRQRATGTGVILSADGYIITNGHVVSNARTVRVRMADAVSAAQGKMEPAGKVVDAKIVGIDRDSDLALIKIDKTGLDPLTLGDSDMLRQGQLVMAFGNPLGLENSVSMGIVSSVARQVKPDDFMVYIQTDAPINPGNSGGPLVDADGHVMGINTFIFSQSGGSEGLGFAIPSNIIKNVYEQLRKEGHVHRGEIGIFAQTITPMLSTALKLPQDWGAILSDVTPEGPADKAGLKAGDIVLAFNGNTIENARQLDVNLYRYKLGDKITVEILRGDAKLTFPVAVTEREDDPLRFADMVDPVKNIVPQLGILGIPIDKVVAQLLPDLRRSIGVVVAARAGESPYSGDSIDLGDVIYEVNGTPVSSVDALRTAIQALKPIDPLALLVERDGRLMYLTMQQE